MINNIEMAKKVFEIEAEAINHLSKNLDENFNKAVELIIQSKGRLVITGMGKSGHIGKKISATLASTGTPSFFMHPAEALHGDLGMLTENDIILAISNSGESEEVLRIIPILKQMNIPLIAMSGKSNSTLTKQSKVFLNIYVEKEACPFELAPTSSTTVSLVMGDALAITLMQQRDFQPEDFALFHPAGSLGRKLLTRVDDIMTKTKLPIVAPKSNFQTVIEVMTSGRLGLCIIMQEEKILGIITDGDLRRALRNEKIIRFELLAQDIMTKSPKSISSKAMAIDAEKYMLKNKINVLCVIDEEKLVGIVQLFDTGYISSITSPNP